MLFYLLTFFFFLQSGKWDPSTTPVDDLFKAVIAILEVGILEPRAQILGGIALFDMEGLTVNHAWHLTPAIVAKVIQVTVVSGSILSQILTVVFYY